MERAERRAAGTFSTWLAEFAAAQDETAQDGAGRIDVPCGSCTACCRSSYFIHIRPEETETLKRIPKELLVPAPGLPKGNMIVGYDERGHCPMLKDDRCSIYEHRPRTCRRYDCRVFAAAGLSAADDGKPEVDEQVRRWEFDLPSADDEVRLGAVRAAAYFLATHPECFGAEPTPTAGQLAMVAIKAYEAFIATDPASGALRLVEPSVDTVRRVLDTA